MPRKSAAARSVESWRVGIGHPAPRRGMGVAAKRLWHEIVESRPADFFTTGSLNMLRTFCEVSVLLEQIGPQVIAAPDDDALLERFRKLSGMQAQMGTKLRLSIQTELRIRTARHIERMEPAKAEAPNLLAGKAWRTGKRPN